MTKTIVNKIQQRVENSFPQLVQVNDTIASVVGYLEGPNKNLPAAVMALDELRDIINTETSMVQAAYGNLLEGQELLSELVDGSANTATLVNNLIGTFMKGDYSILIQSLEILDPLLRREAMSKLSPELRQSLLSDIISAENNDGK